MKHKLLITDNIDETGLKPLEKYFKIENKIGISPDELKKIIGNYHTIITRTSTSIDAGVIEHAKNLRIIGRAAIGVDNIDIFAATDKKIAVINAPKGNAKVTAEHTIGLIFSLLRHVPAAFSDLKNGIWGKQKYVGTQIYGKTLGIVGFGNVGKEVYRIARGIGMNVIVCEPYVRLPKKVRKVTYEELLAESDIITFHVPLTYLTRSMLNKNTLKLCKDKVYIINCSRGGVVEENAVYGGLKSGKIAGFATDVYTKEPPIKKRLLDIPNVIATPHIAGSTFESQKQSIQEVVYGILHYLKGSIPYNLLNPQVYSKKAKKSVRFNFDAVIFDCDSTLSAIEGVDELAKFVGLKDKVARLTEKAMNGELPFEDVFAKRLTIIKPKRQQLEKVGELYIKNLVADAKVTVEALRHLGKEVYIISGGFTHALLKLGEHLGVPAKNIFGNDILFDSKGNYISYIEGPLRRNHGKLQIIRQIPGRKVMVGDSITDLEVKECVDLFVGYGGVVKREKVEKNCDLFLYTTSIAPIIAVAAGVDGCIKLLETNYRKYIGKALDLLFHSNHVKASKTINEKFKEFHKLAYY